MAKKNTSIISKSDAPIEGTQLTIAKIKEQNPNLSHEEIIKVVQDTKKFLTTELYTYQEANVTLDNYMLSDGQIEKLSNTSIKLASKINPKQRLDEAFVKIDAITQTSKQEISPDQGFLSNFKTMASNLLPERVGKYIRKKTVGFQSTLQLLQELGSWVIARQNEIIDENTETESHNTQILNYITEREVELKNLVLQLSIIKSAHDSRSDENEKEQLNKYIIRIQNIIDQKGTIIQSLILQYRNNCDTVGLNQAIYDELGGIGNVVVPVLHHGVATALTRQKQKETYAGIQKLKAMTKNIVEGTFEMTDQMVADMTNNMSNPTLDFGPIIQQLMQKKTAAEQIYLTQVTNQALVDERIQKHLALTEKFITELQEQNNLPEYISNLTLNQ